jgi:hypothetical protein
VGREGGWAVGGWVGACMRVGREYGTRGVIWSAAVH